MSYFFFYHDFKDKNQINLISEKYKIEEGKIILEDNIIEGVLVFFQELNKTEVINQICKIKEDITKKYKIITTEFINKENIITLCNVIVEY